jgi:hypothetical protein
MRSTVVASSLLATLALACTSCVSARREPAKSDRNAGETPAGECRVQVMVLSFDRDTVENLLKNSGLSAPVLLDLWKKGEGQLLTVRTALATSSPGGGAVETTDQAYLYRGVRMGGVRSPGGASIEIPDYKLHDVGMKLRAIITEGFNTNAPRIAVDATTEIVFNPAGDTQPQPSGMENYPSIGTIKVSTAIEMPFGEQILLGGGAESSDKKLILFVVGRADPIDEIEKETRAK